MTLVLAHRGANRDAPENTVEAFLRAVALGADGVELDVQRTSDGALVVRHDAESPAGLLAELTLSEIQQHLPGVPTLAAALDACAGHLVNVEIKNFPYHAGFDASERVAELVVELLADRGALDRTLVSSFHLATVDRVHSLAPQLQTGHLVVGGDPIRALEVVAAHGHAALHPDVGLLGGRHAPELVERAQALGVQLNVWTVNEPPEILRLASIGVDALITDVPDVAVRLLRER